MQVEIFAGRIFPLPPEGTPTGIFKRPLTDAARLTPLGLDVDHQADRRYHGGADKALNHFPAEHYSRLARYAPEQAQLFVPGSIGENISSTGLLETEARIGDIYSLGTCRIQISGPRTPCWKINHRYRHDALVKFIHDGRTTGWYYRVLEEGIVEPRVPLTLLERDANAPTIDFFWQAVGEHRPGIAQLETLASAPGLSQDWQRKLRDRIKWLKSH
jgi:MOSC domain-containing protein YiiM